MKGIIADANIQGYIEWLVDIMRAEPWMLFWDYLHLDCIRFSDVALPADAPDSLVWETCQKNELVLITDNRNDEGGGFTRRSTSNEQHADQFTG